MPNTLVGVGTLTVADYYDKITRLRASNLRFISIEKEEILHHLQQARVENGIVVETRGLAILRRYVAACLLRSEVLQRPPMYEGAPNPKGEIAFLFGLHTAISGALVETWASGEGDESVCQARAEWILANLYLDHLGPYNISEVSRSDEDDRYLVAVNLADLILRALTFKPRPNETGPSMRRKYFEWLFNRVLQHRFEVDLQLVRTITDVLKKYLIEIKTEEEGSAPAIILLLRLFYEDLPDPIQNELGNDTDFTTSIGLKSIITVTVGDLHFNQDDFWRAANEAINGREATIVPIKLDKEITFRPCEDRRGKGVFCFDHPVTGERILLEDDIFELLFESPSEREAALRRNRHWFDCQDAAFERAIAEIVIMEDPPRRVEVIESWQNKSAAVYYANLHRKISQHQRFQWEELLPPSAEGLLRHFRLEPDVEPGVEFQEVFTITAQTLIHEEGLETAIERLTGLPVPLPAVLIEAIGKLSPEDRRAFLKQLFKTAGSPVSKTHFAHVLLRFGGEAPAYGKLARRVMKILIKVGGSEEFEAFLAILKWVNDEFNRWGDVRSWAPHIRFAMIWAHAHRLFTTFVSAGASNAWLRETFDQASKRITYEIFERNPDYWFDIVHPRQISRVPFLLASLSYSLGEEGAKFVDNDLRNLLTEMAFGGAKGDKLPAPSLLKDPTLARDSLGSFLAGDRGERLSALLGAEKAGIFTQSSLQAFTEELVSTLAKTRGDFSAWMLVFAVLGDLPPYKDLAVKLNSILRDTDYVDLFKKDVRFGSIAIQTATLQVIHSGDEDLRCYLKGQLLNIAKYFSELNPDKTNNGAVDWDNFSDPKVICLYLLDWALNVSIAAKSSEDKFAKFADLITQLVEIWRLMASQCKPTIQRFCEELPIAHARYFWALLVRLRAE